MGLWNERENRNMFDYKERMDTLLKQEVATGSVKGASALVLYQGKEIYQNQFGFADAEKEIPMKRDTIIRLFSMTKPITSAAVMLLVERGELDVWDAVSRYFSLLCGKNCLGCRKWKGSSCGQGNYSLGFAEHDLRDSLSQRGNRAGTADAAGIGRTD